MHDYAENVFKNIVASLPLSESRNMRKYQADSFRILLGDLLFSQQFMNKTANAKQLKFAACIFNSLNYQNHFVLEFLRIFKIGECPLKDTSEYSMGEYDEIVNSCTARAKLLLESLTSENIDAIVEWILWHHDQYNVSEGNRCALPECPNEVLEQKTDIFGK